MSSSRGPCADFLLGLWKSTNSVGNIKPAKSILQKAESKLLHKKGPQQGNPSCCLVKHQFIFKHILYNLCFYLVSIKTEIDEDTKLHSPPVNGRSFSGRPFPPTSGHHLRLADLSPGMLGILFFQIISTIIYLMASFLVKFKLLYSTT